MKSEQAGDSDLSVEWQRDEGSLDPERGETLKTLGKGYQDCKRARELRESDRTASAVGNRGFHGTIPREIGRLTRLGYFAMWGTHLEGSIPKEIGNLRSLVYLSLNENDLSGVLPREMGQLSQLQHIYLEDNKLEA